MDNSWAEIWSVGSGRSRMYCGIAETFGEFAVDLFTGDTCVSSQVFVTKAEAAAAAHALRRQYQLPSAPAWTLDLPAQSASA
jgi:hypothetical protein